MVIGVLTVEYALHGNDSLKGKRRVANSLKQACREGGLIARFGGEFLVLLKNITDIIVKANQALLQQLPGK